MQPARLMTSPQPGDNVPEAVVEFAPWFHNIHLPSGLQTAPNHPLGDFPAFKWRQVAECLPSDLTGWRALDVGCNAGFYTIELARRGAEVIGLDVEDHFLRQARWAVRECGVEDRVTFVQGQVYDIASWPDSFDLILFMGVFYHLRYPALALDLLASRVRRRFIFQTLTMPGDEILAVPEDLALDDRALMLEQGWPRMAFIEHRLAGDPTNWWAPNHACITALLRTAGLKITHHPGHEIYICIPADASAQPGINDELKTIFPDAFGR